VEIIEKCAQSLRSDPQNKFVHIKVLTTELKAYTAKPLKHLLGHEVHGVAEIRSPQDDLSEKLSGAAPSDYQISSDSCLIKQTIRGAGDVVLVQCSTTTEEGGQQQFIPNNTLDGPNIEVVNKAQNDCNDVGNVRELGRTDDLSPSKSVQHVVEKLSLKGLTVKNIRDAYVAIDVMPTEDCIKGIKINTYATREHGMNTNQVSGAEIKSEKEMKVSRNAELEKLEIIDLNSSSEVESESVKSESVKSESVNLDKTDHVIIPLPLATKNVVDLDAADVADKHLDNILPLLSTGVKNNEENSVESSEDCMKKIACSSETAPLTRFERQIERLEILLKVCCLFVPI